MQGFGKLEESGIYRKRTNQKYHFLFVLIPCDSCRIQTCNLLIRSQMLYSVELTNHILPIDFEIRPKVIRAGFKPATF